MPRRLPRLCLVLSALLAAASVAEGQQRDEITFYSGAKKKEEKVRAKINSESPAGIAYTVGSRDEKVAAGDVIDVDYAIPAALRIDVLGKAHNLELAALKQPTPAARIKGLDEAITLYRDLAGRLDEYKFAQRYFEFHIARLRARQAEDDPALRDAAVAALKEFKTRHPTSWQLSTCGRLLGRLLTEKGDLPGALEVYEDFARREELPREFRQECDMLVVRALMKAGKTADAEGKLAALAKSLDPKDPQAARVEVYRASCLARTNPADAEKRLLAIIQGDADDSVKALAYNTLGDCYRLNNRPEDAFWQYLRVDIQLSQDREEHAKALYYLAELFETVKKQPERAAACREKLLTDKQFAGLEHQKLAAKK